MDDRDNPQPETKGGAPVRKRDLGVDRSKIHIADDFDAPNADIANLFEESHASDKSRVGKLHGVYGEAYEYVNKERAAWRRPHMSDEEYERLGEEASGGAGDGVSQDDINDAT